MNMNIRRWNSLGTILEATYHEFWKFLLNTYLLGKLHAKNFFITPSFLPCPSPPHEQRHSKESTYCLWWFYSSLTPVTNSSAILGQGYQEASNKSLWEFLVNICWRNRYMCEWGIGGPCINSVWRVLQRKLLWAASYERTKQSIL